MRKYVYVFKDGKKKYTWSTVNDSDFSTNIEKAEAMAKEKGWELAEVRAN